MSLIFVLWSFWSWSFWSNSTFDDFSQDLVISHFDFKVTAFAINKDQIFKSQLFNDFSCIYDKMLLEFVRVQQLHYRFYSRSNPMSRTSCLTTLTLTVEASSLS